MILRTQKIYLFIFIIIAYFSINLLFNFNLWNQIVETQHIDKVTYLGESSFYEYVAEKVYQNIIGGRNPFSSVPDVLYPFGWNFALEDSSTVNGFLFVFLRPFFSIHKSFILILVIGILLSNLSMYYLLTLFGIKKKTAFVMGLVYGFAPFVAIRIGHPTYTALYIFSILMILLFKMYKSKFVSKYIYAFLLGLALNITLLTNIYFTLEIIIICIVVIIYYLKVDSDFLLKYLKKEYKYFAFSLFTAFFTLIPWFIKAIEVLKFHQYTVFPGFLDSVIYSGDLFGIIKGGNFNPFFLLLKILFGKTYFYKYPAFENYIYPGIIIIFFYIFFFSYRHKLPRTILKQINPLLIVGIFFWILSLGPFLHILGWNTHIPLPFMIINNLPLIQLARAPGRFIVPFIFLSTIAAAIVINYLSEKKIKKTKFLLFFCLITIFFLDQRYFASPMPKVQIPIKIYNYLSMQKSGTLFEIPFVIRDGLRYLGSYHYITSPLLQLLHKKAIFGIYAGRIHEGIFSYFSNDPFIGYFARMIDSGNNTESNFNNMFDSINFFDVEYVLLKTTEDYSQKAKSVIDKLEYKIIMSDYNYDLFYKKNIPRDFDNFDLNSPNKNLYLVQGWSDKEKSGKWVVGNIANILFKQVNIHPLELKFRAKAAIESQILDIYINNKYYDKIYLSQGYSSYTLKLNKFFKKGINVVTFKFTKTMQPSILLNNNDQRKLAAFFQEISLDKSEENSKTDKLKPEINKIDFSRQEDEKYLIEGWSDAESKARWIEGKKALVEFPIYQKKKQKKLHLRAESIVKPQRIRVYINNVFSQNVVINHGITDDYYIDTKGLLKNGSNFITFKLDNSYLLGQVLGNNSDIRYASVLMKYLGLEN